MNSTAPQIGFDRFVRLDWAVRALNVRAGACARDEFDEMLDVAGLGAEAKIKTRTKLNALWLEPRAELIDFGNRGVDIFRRAPESVLPLTWGMAIAGYPFFGKVAELIGRLVSLHGDCATAEIQRRVSEIYGNRQITTRATQAVIQTQANWGVIERSDDGKRLRFRPTLTIRDDRLAVWLLESAIRYYRKSVELARSSSLPVLYAFRLSDGLSMAVSRSEVLELRSDGPSTLAAALRDEPAEVCDFQAEQPRSAQRALF